MVDHKVAVLIMELIRTVAVEALLVEIRNNAFRLGMTMPL